MIWVLRALKVHTKEIVINVNGKHFYMPNAEDHVDYVEVVLPHQHSHLL